MSYDPDWIDPDRHYDADPNRRVLRTVYLHPYVDEKLRVFAFRQSVTKNDVIAKALEEYLERNGALPPPKVKRARKRSEKSK